MSITAAELVKTAAISPRVEVREFTGSTNADLLAASADGTWPHLSVLLTDDQRSGRGRLDRNWQAPKGASLALSVLVAPDAVAPEQLGWVPLIAGLAMTEAINAQLGDVAAIKWPNDVLIEDKKICGILAQVGQGGIVVGSGVNTAMTAADAPVDTATSFAMHDATADIDALIATYLAGFQRELAALGSGTTGLRERITAACATIGKTVRIHLPGGDTFVGEAIGLASDGQLTVQSADERLEVSAGDVIHVR